jgi:heme-degrading monooxygenase HmoA
MPFISITRLRIRSVRFLPGFALHALQVLRQVKRADGFQDGALLPDRSFTFWTMTAWVSQESMRRYMTAGAHKKAMAKLMDWCDEASVVHWERNEDALPSWTEADRRMRAEGRASKVRNPSPQHATLSYRAPRLTGGGPIRRVGGPPKR